MPIWARCRYAKTALQTHKLNHHLPAGPMPVGVACPAGFQNKGESLMNVYHESVFNFITGRGTADQTPKVIVDFDDCDIVAKGVTIKADSENTVNLFVGTSGVTPATGYKLAPSEEMFIPVSRPWVVFVVADGVAAYSWLAI